MPFVLDDLILLGLAGAGLGGAKHLAIDMPKRIAAGKLRGEEIRTSTWTRRGPTTEVPDADLAGSMLKWGLTGATFGQGIQNNKLAGDINKAYLDRLKAGTASAHPVPFSTLSPAVAPGYGFTPAGAPIYSPWARPYDGFGG